MDLLTRGEFTLDEMNVEFISHFHLQVNPVLGVWISCLVRTRRLGISLWAELCRRCCFSTTLCNLLFDICMSERFVQLPILHASSHPLCSYFFPHEVSLILLGRKALLEIAYFINCLVTQGVEC